MREIEPGRAALFGSMLLALAGCTPQQPADDPEVKDVTTVEYVCEDGTKLDIWFEPETAIISENDGATLILSQQRSGSGMWYAANGLEFRGKGQTATWKSGSRPSTQCKDTDLVPSD